MRKGKRRKRREHNHLIPHQGEPVELAARLTPLEEMKAPDANNGGAIVVDTSALNLPKDFTQRQEKGGRVFGLELIGLIILAFSIAFIAFITYLISIEPVKPEDKTTVTSDK